MKYKRISLAIIATALTLGHGAVFAQIKQNESTAPVAAVVATAPVEKTEVQAASEAPQVQTPEAPVTETQPVVEQPSAPTAPVYRTFDQIILDYPSMSQGYHAIECSHVLYAAYPERFTPEKAEYNVKLIASRFASSCSASHKAGNGQPDVIDGLPLNYLMDLDGTGDFWAKYGGL